MPKVGRLRFAGSGFLVSRPPGFCCQETMPQSAPAQSMMRIWAFLLATTHSPVGSVANAIWGSKATRKRRGKIARMLELYNRRPSGGNPGRFFHGFAVKREL